MLTLYWDRGGRAESVPSDFEVEYFFPLLTQTPPKLVTVLKSTRQQYKMTCHCPRDITFPRQPYFDRRILIKISIFLVIKLNISFLVVILSLYWLYLLLNRFRRLLEVWKNGWWRWPPFKNDYVIIRSRDVITSWCETQMIYFQTYYLPSKCHSPSFYILEATEVCWGGGGSARPQS